MAVNPRLITLAREARGLVQLELAGKLGVGQGTLSKVEGGVLPAPDGMVDKLAVELDFPASFFTQADEVHGLGTDAYHQLYRRRKSLPVKSLKRVEAMVNLVRMHLARFLRSMAIETERTIPRLDIDDYSGNAEQIAGVVRAAWAVPSGPIDNMVALLESAGAIVVPFDFGTDQIDATSVRVKDLPPMIFFNRALLSDRCRFTLAHELGHLVMHVVPSASMEDEADRFASEFLMPAREIGPQLQRLTLRRAAQLKPHWKVSMAALVYRAQALGKIQKQDAQRLYIAMSAAGYKTREPVELDLPLEHPATHRALVDFHMNELGYSPEEMCRLLNINTADFRSLYGSEAARHRPAVTEVWSAGSASVYSFPARGGAPRERDSTG